MAHSNIQVIKIWNKKHPAKGDADGGGDESHPATVVQGWAAALLVGYTGRLCPTSTEAEKLLNRNRKYCQCGIERYDRKGPC